MQADGASSHDGHVAEDGGFQHGVVVGGHAQADLDVRVHLYRRVGDQRPVGAVGRDVAVEVVTAADQLDPRGGGCGRAVDVRGVAGPPAAFELGDVVGVQHHGHLGGVGGVAVADHDAGFGPVVGGGHAVDAGDDRAVAVK